MTDKRGEHLKAINAKRALTVRALKQSEKAISDTARLKQEQEAASAARKWDAAMELAGKRRI